MTNKKNLFAKQPLIGSWINSASTIIAEIMSASGFDFLVVDAEHSAVDVPQTLALFQAIKSGNPDCYPMVRLPGHSYDETKRYLDAGAMGVIAPLINTRADAEEIIRSVKYPPWGERGVGFGRSHEYGFNFDAYMANANDNTFVGIQIEHIKGVENIDDIFSVPGIDCVFIGPYDLTASMGITAEFNHPRYIETREYILSKCAEYNITAGIHVVQPDTRETLEMVDKGFNIIAYSLDITILGYYSRLAIRDIQKGVHNDT